MGYETMESKDWDEYAKSNIKGKTTAQIYKSTKMKPEYDPMKVMRESRDSYNHPSSTPIIIGLDVTGSMDNILNEVAQQVGDMVLDIIKRKPISDPQVAFAAIGDAPAGDEYPFQVTQFESDIKIAHQLTDLYFEKRGGGNYFESYPLTWWFAANHTACDNFEKRNEKGFLFTMGDDDFPKELTARELSAIFGDTIEGNSVSIKEVLTQASRKWEIFHLVLQEGNNMLWGGNKDVIVSDWISLLGERAIPVTDYRKIPQIITSILERMSGKSVDEICDSWDGSTAVVVREAIQGLTVNKENNGLIEF